MSSSHARPLRVVKLGGSLLLCRDLARRWRCWLDQQPAAANLLVVGGGQVVNAVRAADEAHRLPALAAHALAIESMSVTARLAALLLEDVELLAEPDAVAAWMRSPRAPAIFDLGSLWRTEPWRETFAPIEPSWDATSDSLAAALARCVGAAELALLKSADAPPGATLAALAAAGYVDRYFPQAAAGLAVRWVNLRGAY
jgi:aspartokinase-like uncharacterized kinase